MSLTFPTRPNDPQRQGHPAAPGHPRRADHCTCHPHGVFIDGDTCQTCGRYSLRTIADTWRQRAEEIRKRAAA